MLADPALTVTDRFGLRNRNFNNFKFPHRPGLPVPTSYKDLANPKLAGQLYCSRELVQTW